MCSALERVTRARRVVRSMPRVAGLWSTRCVMYDNPEAERNRFTFTGWRLHEHMVMASWLMLVHVETGDADGLGRGHAQPVARSAHMSGVVYLAHAPSAFRFRGVGVWVEEPSARVTGYTVSL